jgi:hypothetical protein|tara:strand:- start:168 stop:782 length:615 start_codon:yes stop_codon:yes gene_type:complete
MKITISELRSMVEEAMLDEKKKSKGKAAAKRKSKKKARRKKRKAKKTTAKRDACYHKVKSRYDVWPSAYASGALVKCRKVGAKNWGNKSEGVEDDYLRQLVEEEIAALAEKKKTDGKGAGSKNYSLRDWFKGGGWVQTGGRHDGKPCAKQPGQKTKPYCRDPDDRAKLSKKEKDKRAAKKRKKDPNPDRKGKAKTVTQKKRKKG